MTINKTSTYKTIFWDFDGVIKDSIEAKTEVFCNIFLSFGVELVDKICKHHLENGGMSRFEKIPLYLKWCKQKNIEAETNKYIEKFSDKVIDKVLSSMWVPGVLNYLNNFYKKQNFIIVSGTPQDEMELILEKTQIKKYFLSIFGAPVKKKDAIKDIIDQYDLNLDECLLIGDAKSDLDAATSNKISFLLRTHKLNKDYFLDYTGMRIENFNE